MHWKESSIALQVTVQYIRIAEITRTGTVFRNLDIKSKIGNVKDYLEACNSGAGDE